MENEIANFYVGGAGGYYEKPSVSNLETAKKLFEQLLVSRSVAVEASKTWNSLGFTFKTLVEGDVEFAIVSETPKHKGRGNGFYVVKLLTKKRQTMPTPQANIVLQAMHTPSDLHTHKVAFKLLMESSLIIAAAWNTTHRRNVDLGKEVMSYFNSFTAAVASSFSSPKIIQLHAFDANSHKIKGDMIISSSKLQASVVDEEQYQKVVSRMRAELTKFVILQFPKDVKELGGTLNINAKVFYENNPKGLFFHVEMSMPLRLDMRDKQESRSSFIRSFL